MSTPPFPPAQPAPGAPYAPYPPQDSSPSAAYPSPAPAHATGAFVSGAPGAFPPPDAAVAAWGLTRAFGQRYAVNGLTLAVRRGEFFGFLGPNGAGKSTTIKMLVGLLRPTAGAAYIGGVDVWRDPLRAKQLIGVLPEHLNLYERLTGRELIEFAGRLYDIPPAEVRHRAAALLDALMLANDAEKLIVDYSVGMRKKIALAAALVHRPQVLFLDEPFEGIDPVSSRVIRTILRDLTANGATIFFSSHIMEVVERLCTRIGIIASGVLVAEGTLDELRQRVNGMAAPGTAPAQTLEDVFLGLVGAQSGMATREGGLSWLE